MVAPISPIRFPATPSIELRPAAGVAPGDFGGAFREAIRTVDKLGANASDSVQRFLAGEGGELHQVALEAQRAQLAFELFLQVRNKVVEAYQEVMRSQI